MKYIDLLFDVDDTLLDFKKDEHEAIIETFKVLNIEPCNGNIQLYSAINSTLWELHNQGKYEKSKIRVSRFKYTLDVLQRNDIDAQFASDTYVKCLGNTGNLLPNVIETLNHLKNKGYRISLITNGFTAIQTPRLKRSGLTNIADYVFISESIGYNKPDKSFIDTISKTIKRFNPNKALIIGDSVSSDIQLGINTNIDTVFINPCDCELATYCFTAVYQLKEIL